MSIERFTSIAAMFTPGGSVIGAAQGVAGIINALRGGGRRKRAAKALYVIVERLQKDDNESNDALAQDLMFIARIIDPKNEALQEYVGMRDAVKNMLG